MMHRALADLLVIAHGAFIAFALFGALLALRFPRLAWVHLPCAIWGVVVEATGSICPLTPLENHLRRLAGSAGYSSGFIEHYLVPTLYPTGLTDSARWALAAALLCVNIGLYALLWHRQRVSRRPAR